MRENQKGMSLIEIIVVIGIIGILAGVSVSLFGYIRSGNTKSAVKELDSAIDRLQINNMSKSTKEYLYVYQSGSKYYVKRLSENLDSFDSTKLDDSGEKIGDSGVKIYKDSSDGTLVTGNDFIRIGYAKSGIYDSATNVSAIVVDGSTTYTITLVASTGKHIVE